MQWEQDLVEAALAALRALPEAQADLTEWPTSGRDGGYDALIALQIAGASVTLIVEAKRTLYPRDVRELVWQARPYRQPPADRAEQRLLFIVANALSPGAKELLRAERIGYFDSAGSLFVPARGAFVHIDKPMAEPVPKVFRSVFSGRRTQVLQALLQHPGRWVNVKALVEQSQASPATVSEVLAELERYEWVESHGQGPKKERRLREPGALLDAWSKHLASSRPRTLRRYYVPAIKPDDLPERLARVLEQHQVAYAITDEAAAQRYAPFLTRVAQLRCRLMPGSQAEAALAELGVRPVTEGANLVLIETPSPAEMLFREKRDGLWLASPIQVYLDLMRSEGRAKELAAHLRQERIGF